MKIKTLARFLKETSIESVEEFEWIEFVFYLENIGSYNEASENYTTIELMSGTRQTIAIKWCDFEELIGKDYTVVINPKAMYEFNEQE